MDIHEYQAKEILSSFGVTIPRGGIVYSPETCLLYTSPSPRD